MTFLIVDDERVVTSAIARLIPAKEPVVILHESSVAAKYATTGTFTAFIIDVRLRGGDGFELFQSIRKHHPLTPAVILTGLTGPGWNERAAALGAELMVKPFETARLRLFIANALQRASPRSAPVVAPPPSTVRGASSRGCVYLVEDHEPIANYVSRMLDQDGFSVVSLSPSNLPVPVETLAPNDHIIAKLRPTASSSSLDRWLEAAQRECPSVNIVVGTQQLALVGTLMQVANLGWSESSGRANELRDRLRALLRHEVTPVPPSSEGKPRGMERVLSLVDKVARSARAPVLLVGESGVGKEVLAARIHDRSPRRKEPFVKVNVAAIADGMVEAELFGSIKGAFTDARRDRVGLLASAHGGTLLLDEIGECRPEIQVKLLRVMETQRYFPVGSDEERVVDVRLIGATNRAAADVLSGGTFRTDLLFRFGTVIEIPPLRERRSEIMPLAEGFATRAAEELGRGAVRFHRAVREALENHDWPGNIRELKHAVGNAVLLAEGPELTLELFELRSSRSVQRVAEPASADGLAGMQANAERAMIVEALNEAGGSVSLAARKLRVARSTLYEKLKKHGL